MQALILTAGEGKRLRPLTDHLPKCLIPVAGKPVLDYQLAALNAMQIRDITLVIGAHEQKVRTHLAGRAGTRTVFNPQYASTNILFSFAMGLRSLSGEDDLVVLAGDVVFEERVVSGLLAAPKDGLVLCVNRKACGDEEVKVLVEQGRVTRLGKRLDPAGAYGEFLGVFLVRRPALARMKKTVEDMIASGRQDGYLFDMINRLIEEEPSLAVCFEVGDCLWEEIDFPEDVERVSARLLSRGRV